MNEQSVPSMRERWNNRAVFQLLWPLIIEQILGIAIGLVDTMMMTAVGEYAVSGVALVDAIAALLIIAFGALATGGAVVISQYLGRGDVKNSSSAAKQLIYVSALAACLIMLVAVSARGFLLRLIYGRIAADVMAAAKTYFFFSALSYPALALYNASAALFRCMGNSRVTMLVSLGINLVHIVLNFIFIYGLGLGVSGAALSTLASRVLGGTALLFLLVRGKRRSISLAGLFKIRLDGRLIRSILRIGIPSGIENSLFQFGKIFVSRIAASFGTAAIAANAVTGSITNLMFMPGTAFGMALLAIAGQCVGARDYDAVRYFTRRLMVLTYAITFLLCASGFAATDSLISLFNLGGEAHDMTRRYLRYLCVTMSLAYPSAFTLPNALRAAGDVKYVMAVAVVSCWLVRVLGAYGLAYGAGVGTMGIWYAWSADWFVRSGFFIPRWLGGKWREKRVLEDS